MAWFQIENGKRVAKFRMNQKSIPGLVELSDDLEVEREPEVEQPDIETRLKELEARIAKLEGGK